MPEPQPPVSRLRVGLAFASRLELERALEHLRGLLVGAHAKGVVAGALEVGLRVRAVARGGPVLGQRRESYRGVGSVARLELRGCGPVQVAASRGLDALVRRL